MTRVITYARVSGDDQARKGTSLPEQERMLRAYAASNGMELVEHIADPGRTGGNLHRPGMDRLRQLVARGDIDVVIATHGDRLSRDHIDSLNLMSELAEHGCAIRVITEGTDTGTLFGQFQNGLTSLLAQHWRAQAAERTTQGRLAAAREGRFVGSTPPFGYRVVGERKARRLEIDEDQARTVRAVYEMLVIGRIPAKEVAADLNARGWLPAKKEGWDAPTLRRWAKTEAHVRTAAGTWVFDVVEVPIPAIISQEEAAVWLAWQRDARTSTPQRAPERYLLSQLLLMPCGRRGMGRQTSGRKRTYSCRDRLTTGVDGHDECRNVDADRLEATVVDTVREHLLQPDVLRAAVAERGPASSPAAELVRVQEDLAKLQSRFRTEAAMWREMGLDPEDAESAMSGLVDQKRGLRDRERTLKRQLTQQQTGKEARQVERAVRLLAGRIDTAGNDVWRAVLQTLEVKVTIREHIPCEDCSGTGYRPFQRGAGRQAPRRCRSCLSGTQPVLNISLTDVLALAVAEGLDDAANS